MNIINQQENILLSRNEIEAEIEFEKQQTPSNADVRIALANKLKVDVNSVVIKHIKTKYGHTKATVQAYQYTNKEHQKLLEVLPKKQREALKKKADESKTQKESKKEENTAAEKKEEQQPSKDSPKKSKEENKPPENSKEEKSTESKEKK